jgi:7-carboxy-7-deazaguanine synthase
MGNNKLLFGGNLMSEMIVSEVFRSLQGEGVYSGVPSVFFRLSGCNLRCQWLNQDGTKTRCDTPYASWDTENHPMSLDDAIQEIRKYHQPKDHIVITGGEPTLQHVGINALLENFRGVEVTIETNGTNPVEMLDVSLLSISPKLNFSGNTRYTFDDYVARVNKLIELNDTDVQIKFVVSNPSELEIVTDFADKMDGKEWIKFMLMPQGITPEQLDSRLGWLAAAALERGWSLTDRQHIRIWKGRRGV